MVIKKSPLKKNHCQCCHRADLFNTFYVDVDALIELLEHLHEEEGEAPDGAPSQVVGHLIQHQARLAQHLWPWQLRLRADLKSEMYTCTCMLPLFNYFWTCCIYATAVQPSSTMSVTEMTWIREICLLLTYQVWKCCFTKVARLKNVSL